MGTPQEPLDNLLPHGSQSAASEEKSKSLEDENVIDFGKFLLAREGGSMIPWSKFLLVAEEEAAPLVARTSAEQYKVCQRVYQDAVRAMKEQEAKAYDYEAVSPTSPSIIGPEDE